MKNLDFDTVIFLETLQPILSEEQMNRLIELFHWEKELSWHSGFDTCETQLDYLNGEG
jgi:hypothetical protein